MKNNVILFTIVAILLVSCNKNKEKENLNHHGEDKVQFTCYTNDFELFAEADIFMVGEKANILSHFSKLPSFKALEVGKVTLSLIVNGNEVKQTLDKPTRKGIYSFDITPTTAGMGVIKIQIDTFFMEIKNVQVCQNQDELHKMAKKEPVSKVNTIVFTKEQSWKIDFKTEFPKKQPFGLVIKTVAKIEPSTGDEILIAAKSSGIVVFPNFNLLEGNNINKGQNLFIITTSGFSDNNISVKLSSAKNNFDIAEKEYIRKKELLKEKIISEKEYQIAKNNYDNAKLVYDNLVDNFSSNGQSISSPMNGFVKQIHVNNGQYVEIGQPMITISQSQSLVLKALVQQKYTTTLSSIFSANIKTVYDNKTYTFEELNGKFLSVGKSANEDNYLIPVYLQIDNKGSFIQGSLVELYIKTITKQDALTVPNSALLEEQGIFFVLVQVNPELFEKREVKIGNTDGFDTEIITGLLPNERIISSGTMLVKLAQSAGALDAHSGHVH